MSHPLVPLIEEFLTDLQNSGMSNSTVNAYRCTLYNFTCFFTGTVDGISAGILRRYLITVNGSPI